MTRWDLARLLEQVREHSRVDANGCWIWVYGVWANGIPDPGRYPKITIGGVKSKVSRLVLEVATGATGEQALHSCDVPACVNPGHLRWGTQLENIADMMDRGRFVLRPRKGDEHWSRNLSDEARAERSRQQREYWAQPEVRALHSRRMQEIRKERDMRSQ